MNFKWICKITKKHYLSSKDKKKLIDMVKVNIHFTLDTRCKYCDILIKAKCDPYNNKILIISRYQHDGLI